MRRVIFVSGLLFLFLGSYSQKASVMLYRSPRSEATEWRILDTDMYPVVEGTDYGPADSVVFGLDENTRYYLELSVPGTVPADSALYYLSINGEAVMIQGPGLSPGDHFFTFFTGVKQPVSKITGGTGVSISQYPWQVFFEAGNYTCGGSIIAGNWILTAAHCTQDDSGRDIPVTSMDVIVGANNPRTGDGRKYPVIKVIRHENYNNSTLDNDIALLQVSQAINYTNATPIRLVSSFDVADGATAPGVMAMVTGYGLTKPVPPTYPTTLQAVELPIVTNQLAATVWPGIIPSSDMMAGYKNGNKDACNGDSGGPLVVPVDGAYKLAGLVSWGSSNCNTYGAYTRVSDFGSWITNRTGIEISYVPPVPSGDSIVCYGTPSSGYNIGALDGVTAWEWQLSPAEAGSVAADNAAAIVTWNSSFTGIARLRLRVTRNGIVSYWSTLPVHVAKNTSLDTRSADTVICSGEPVTLNIGATGYNLHYAWYRNDTLIQDGSSQKFIIAAGRVSSTGIYRCDISGSCGALLSPETSLTVLPVTVITGITPDKKASFGDNITLDVSAGGHDLRYQWEMDGSVLRDETASSIQLVNVNASNTGLYKVDVKGSCGELLSNGVYLYVSDNPKQNDPSVFVWPTVVSEDLNVALDSDDEYDLQIFSATGGLVIDKRHCRYRTTLSLGKMPAGLYIVKVSNNNFIKSVKLIRN